MIEQEGATAPLTELLHSHNEAVGQWFIDDLLLLVLLMIDSTNNKH